MSAKLTSVNDLLLAICKTISPFQPEGIIEFNDIKIIWDRKEGINPRQWNYTTKVCHAWRLSHDLENVDTFADEIEKSIGQDVHRMAITDGKYWTDVYNYGKYPSSSKQHKVQDGIRSSIDKEVVKKLLLCGKTIGLFYGYIPRFRFEMYKVIKESKGAATADAGCYMKLKTISKTFPSMMPMNELLDSLIIPNTARLICNSKDELNIVLNNFPNSLIMIILEYVF